MSAYRSSDESSLSSSDDEKPVGAPRNTMYRLNDDSSDEESVVSEKKIPQEANPTVSDLAMGMSKIEIQDKKVAPKKHFTQSKLKESDLWSSDEDDDSIMENYKPTFRKKSKAITFDDSDDDSSVATSNVDVNVSPKSETSKSSKKWRFSVGRKEYSVSEESDEAMPNFRIPGKLFDALYNHQKEGVAWLAGLHVGRIGGLLGDDMGMGKTYQALTFLGGMMRARTIRNALVVAPVSVLRSWEKEANHVVKMCVPNVCIKVVSSYLSKPSRRRTIQSALQCPLSRPLLIISTYGLIGSSVDDFTNESHEWDYIVLDEAHKIKNPSTKVAKNIRLVAQGDETRRLIMTGTPIMNNLRELWALFDFVTSGRLLGPSSTFNSKYSKPIEDARSKNATKFEIEAGLKANQELQQKLKPFLLQRLKVDYMAEDLPTKKDFVVWTHLSPKQRDLYSEYVNAKDSAVADVLSGLVTSPLEALSWLKKLCGHPALVAPKDFSGGTNLSPSELMRDSSKLQVLDRFVEDLCTKGHRILVFSQSTKMLDIIEKVLRVRVKELSRIDGKTKEKDRQRLVDMFNAKGSPTQVMLLSTGAGGVGLTLTGADTAIVYDPSWNPAEDSQAVDRCYRIGQDKAVTVYRFIAAGTVEEKMYEKQVHKDGIRRAVVTNVGSSLTRYFDKHDLRQVFKLNPAGQCDFLDRLGYAYTGTQSSATFHRGVVGISSHDILYTEDASDVDEEDGPPPSESQENPFSSPSKITHFTLHEPSNEEASQTKTKALGKSQRVLTKGGGSDGALPIALNTLGDTTNKKAKGEITIEGVFKKVDRLTSNGQRVDALEKLMDAMDHLYAGLDKREKELLHNRISSVSHELGWL